MPRYFAFFIALGCVAAMSTGRLAAAPESERPAASASPAPRPASATPGQAVTRPRIPLRFEPLDTTDNGTRTFTARTAGYTVRVAPTWAEIRTIRRDTSSPAKAFTLHFDGAEAGPREVHLEGATSTVNYTVGADRAGWRTGLEARGRVRFAEVYPGIDVAYYGTDADVEYDVMVAAGADPSRVRLRLAGAGRVAIGDDGDLELGPGDVPVRLRAPFAYQMDGSRRIAVGSRYVLHADGTVGFALARYDRTKALVIDPILSYSRLLGGSGLDEAVSVAVDATGNVYLAGTTSSAGFGGAPGGPAGLDVFVTKLDSRGTTVLFSTYVGGSGVDEAHAMTLDALGNVYVVGSTTSLNFPTASPRQASLGGAADGFLFRLSAGGGLGFSTYFGGNDNDEINAITLDAGRNMYIAGTTRSANFPVLNPAQPYGGALDGFVARFTAAGTLTYSTYHGGSGIDTLEGIGVDGAGNVTVAGTTTSPNLPAIAAPRPTYAGNVDAFFSRFSVNGALVYCSYFGGTGRDVARAVAELASGWTFIAGSTSSADLPVVSPIQAAFGGGVDAWLLAISPSGGLSWATYYGGTRSERGRALAVNPSGKLIFAGQTFSPDMPVVRPAQARTGGNRDTFVVELDPPYTSFTYATYLGGSDNDEGSGVAVDGVGRVFTAGTADYASDTGAAGPSDAFVYGLSSGLAGADTDGDGLPDDWETQFGLDPNTNDAAADPDGDGFTNAQEYANHTHPTGYFTRYLAEGSTGAFFDDRIALFNPNADIATVVLRFQRDAGGEIQQTMSLPAHSRQTVNPELIAGLEAVAFSTAIESNQPVVVDRTMTWDSSGFGSHAETSIEQPSTQWFLAEGSTAGNFDLYYLLQNPNAATANVTITYLRPDGAPLTKSYTVNPRSRRTINIDNETGFTGRPATERSLQSADVSAQIVATNGVPILVERAMYMTAQGRVFAAGHDSAGVTSPQVGWFLAEGATGSFFDLFILLANPNTTPTTVEVTYLLLGGQPVTRQYGLPAQSRRTIYVNAEPGLADVATSAIVRSLNAAVPIVVERSMWWPRGNWTEAHNSDGAILTSPKWALAEGEVGGTASTTTYVLIANTSSFPATVTATAYFEDQGQPFVRNITIPANSRYNVDYAGTVAQGRRFSVMVESTGPSPSQEPQLVVERAMYSNSGSVVWAAGTDALGTPIFPPLTFTVTPNGVFPKTLLVDEGQQIRIFNRDPNGPATDDCASGGHNMSDDPHPTHGDSPEFGSGDLAFNQSRLTQNLVTIEAFGVHDHCHGIDPRYKARVIVRDTP